MSSHHDAYVQGYTHPTMGFYKRSRNRKVEPIPKRALSWDCRLKFACMNPELVVIADQQTAVNTFSPLAHTARQTNRVLHW